MATVSDVSTEITEPNAPIDPVVSEPEYEDDTLEGDDAPPEIDLIPATDPASLPPDEGNAATEEGVEHRKMSISGLSAPRRIRARDLACNAALLTIRHASEIHYTQDERRWEGIAKGLKAYKGQYPRYADCSSLATWWLWQGLDHYGIGDAVNDTSWSTGNTESMLQHGKRVRNKNNWLRGDLILYGHSFPKRHVAMYLGDGWVASHGSENGPYKLRWDYRADVIQVRRYI